ncbi:uncharacterized protein [Anabrus simplex]|uniref:uncharacterized protein n=1 Tax=Anabrus simplex TaxID=316456 RepID=UPI0035A2C4EF
MPLYNDINLYYGSSSLTNPLPSSSYYSPFGLPSRSVYSGGTLGLMPTPRLLPSRAGYSPLLPTISETSSFTSLPRRPLTPLSRIGSPRITSSYLPPKPIRIDTADIDVSTPRTPRVDRERSREQEGQEFSRQGTIKRGRTVVRLHTKKPKDNPALQRRKQTPGERLMEKFLIKDKIAEAAKEERQRKLDEQERLERLQAEALKTAEQPLVPPQPPSEDHSSIILTENAALDILLSTQEEVDSHLVETARTEEKKETRNRTMRLGKKTKKRDLIRQTSEPSETIWMMEDESGTEKSPLQRRNTVKKLRRNSQDISDSETISCPNSRRSSLDVDAPPIVAEEEELKLAKNITVKRKRGDKQKIVADISVDNSISAAPLLKSPVKFIVDDIQVEESPASPRTLAKKFRYEVTVQELDESPSRNSGKENRVSGDKKLKKKAKGVQSKQQASKTSKIADEKLKKSPLKSEMLQEESIKDCKPNVTSKSFQSLHKSIHENQTSVLQKTSDSHVDSKQQSLLKDKTVNLELIVEGKVENRKPLVSNKQKESKLEAGVERDEGYVSKRRRSDPKIAKVKDKEVQSGVFIAEKKKSPIMTKIIPKLEDIKTGKRVIEKRPEEKKKGPKRQGDPAISLEPEETPTPTDTGVNFWAFLNSLDDEYKPVTLKKALSLDIVSASDVSQNEQSAGPSPPCESSFRKDVKTEEPIQKSTLVKNESGKAPVNDKKSMVKTSEEKPVPKWKVAKRNTNTATEVPMKIETNIPKTMETILSKKEDIKNNIVSISEESKQQKSKVPIKERHTTQNLSESNTNTQCLESKVNTNDAITITKEAINELASVAVSVTDSKDTISINEDKLSKQVAQPSIDNLESKLTTCIENKKTDVSLDSPKLGEKPVQKWKTGKMLESPKKVLLKDKNSNSANITAKPLSPLKKDEAAVKIQHNTPKDETLSNKEEQDNISLETKSLSNEEPSGSHGLQWKMTKMTDAIDQASDLSSNTSLAEFKTSMDIVKDHPEEVSVINKSAGDKTIGKTDKVLPLSPKQVPETPGNKTVPKWKLNKTTELQKKVNVGEKTKKLKPQTSDQTKSETPASAISDDDFWGAITGTATIDEHQPAAALSTPLTEIAKLPETKEEHSPVKEQEPQKVMEKRVPKLKVGKSSETPNKCTPKEKPIAPKKPSSDTADVSLLADKSKSNQLSPSVITAIASKEKDQENYTESPKTPSTPAFPQTNKKPTETEAEKCVPKGKADKVTELPKKPIQKDKSTTDTVLSVEKTTETAQDEDFWGKITAEESRENKKPETASIAIPGSPRSPFESSPTSKDVKILESVQQDEKRIPKWKIGKFSETPKKPVSKEKAIDTKTPSPDSKSTVDVRLLDDKCNLTIPPVVVMEKEPPSDKDQKVSEGVAEHVDVKDRNEKEKFVKVKKVAKRTETEESMSSSPVAKRTSALGVVGDKIAEFKDTTIPVDSISESKLTERSTEANEAISQPSPISKPETPHPKPIPKVKFVKPPESPKKPLLKGEVCTEAENNSPHGESNIKDVKVKKSETSTELSTVLNNDKNAPTSKLQNTEKETIKTDPSSANSKFTLASPKPSSTPITLLPETLQPVEAEVASDTKDVQKKTAEGKPAPTKKVVAAKKPKQDKQAGKIPDKTIEKKQGEVNVSESTTQKEKVESSEHTATVPELAPIKEKETTKEFAESGSKTMGVSKRMEKDSNDKPKPKVVKVKKVAKIDENSSSKTDSKETSTSGEDKNKPNVLLPETDTSLQLKQGVDMKSSDTRKLLSPGSEDSSLGKGQEVEKKNGSLSDTAVDKKEEETDEDETTTNSVSTQRGSTSSDDSGFDSLPTSMPVPSSSSSEGRDPVSPAPSLASNPSLDPYDDGSSDSSRPGWQTPPAMSLPRFRKYTVEDFQFLKVLGKGSFGKVLLAELKGTDRYYAVKCLKKDVVLEDDDVECTLIERKVLALGTKHPYLCHLFCTFQTESHLLFVMEYLNGGDLMFHIQQSGRFPEPRARFYAAEIVCGLKFLHKKGIVYRDLKLDNILLDFEGHVRIADFGMCKLQIFLERTADTFCGTPDYMAPEIIKGLKYNQCVDWWSFGVLLFEMLVGVSPFNGCDEDDLFWSICNEQPHYPRFLSREANSILTMLLEKDASKRLGTPFNNTGDVADHPFFRSIDWIALEHRELDPPFKPRVKHPLDVQYFDKAFTAEKAILTPIDKSILQSMDQTQFQGFSYTNPNATD